MIGVETVNVAGRGVIVASLSREAGWVVYDFEANCIYEVGPVVVVLVRWGS